MEMLVRFSAFVGVFSGMAVWEYWRPCRQLLRPRRERWVTNLSLTTLNSLLVWATVGSVAYATAVFAAEQGVGLLHWITLPPWAAAVVTLLGLDFAVYMHHVLFHAVPIFWRLHQVHHADLDIDATTGLRFHPFEIFLSFGLKMAAVILLGAVPWVVVAFEILLNASSVFNHSNVAMPERVLAQVMNIGDYDDVQIMVRQVGDKALQHVLTHAEVGQFNERSWVYWHYRLGLADGNEVPPMPVQKFA